MGDVENRNVLKPSTKQKLSEYCNSDCSCYLATGEVFTMVEQLAEVRGNWASMQFLEAGGLGAVPQKL